MKRMVSLSAAAVLLCASGTLAASADVGVGPGGGTPGTSSKFQLVGHDPLFGRGMNAALALYSDSTSGRTFVYVGNRTDGSKPCDQTGNAQPCHASSNVHTHPQILIEDVTHPSAPVNVGKIGRPYAAQPGITTRELRVWPRKKLLMVMTFRCSSVIHDCAPGDDTTFGFDLKFFDLTDPVHPRFIGSYVPTDRGGDPVKPHEMYLWVDPNDANRALLWLSAPSVSVDPHRPNLLIADISSVPGSFTGHRPAPLGTRAPVTDIAEGNWNQLFPGASHPRNYDYDLALHSMALTADGKRTYLAYLRGGFFILDTSAVVHDTNGTFINLNNDLLTRPKNFVTWGAGNTCAGHTFRGCSESHSAVPVPGRPFDLSTDEVYGTFTAPSFGWPWGWARLINVADPRHPRLVGQYKIFQNTKAFQNIVSEGQSTQRFTSYSSHNPTVLRRLALIAWHSGGLQAVDIAHPSAPTQAGWFSPKPLASVSTEDPALNGGPNKVTIWSYPIIKDGLVYVIDIRNGLYILRYTGADSSEVSGVKFLEGNSNLGDLVRLSNGGH
ncbi:MAG: LVIVD repeat-containing protein [Nocardioidaceae bacterium]